jgi:hypothetical protein
VAGCCEYFDEPSGSDATELVSWFVCWSQFAVKGFWVLWYNIYDCVCLLLYIFPSSFMGNFGH